PVRGPAGKVHVEATTARHQPAELVRHRAADTAGAADHPGTLALLHRRAQPGGEPRRVARLTARDLARLDRPGIHAWPETDHVVSVAAAGNVDAAVQGVVHAEHGFALHGFGHPVAGDELQV